MLSPLCKITYSIPSEQILQQQCDNQQQLVTNYLEIFPGMTTFEIADIIGDNIGCGYDAAIEEQIRNQLSAILRDGNRDTNRHIGDEEVWRDNMEKIIGIQASSKGYITPQVSQKRFNSKYFQLNYEKFFKNRSDKHLNSSTRENNETIYQRSLAKKRKTQQKLSMIKKNKEQKEVVECTFSPNIANTLQFFNKKNPKFFKQNDNQKQNIKENTFERLYKNSFDIREKKNKRLRTLQNQQESKFSELSFAPVINQCSRQICRMKSYASFVSELSQIHEKQHQKPKSKQKQKQKFNKAVSKQNTVKKNKGQACTFQPQLSQNTKRMTKNLPGFYARLESSKEKKKTKQNKSSNQKQISMIKNAQKQNRLNKIVLKKQIYTIEDGSQQQKQIDELQTQKKPKPLVEVINIPKGNLDNVQSCKSKKQKTSKQPNIQPKPCSKPTQYNRSSELFNTRKKAILQRIVKYFTISPPIKIQQFSKKPSTNTNANGKINTNMNMENDPQVEIGSIEKNPYVPNLVKDMISPITQELKETNISLTESQFVWALETLFNGLSLSDRGSLLAWGVKLLPQDNDS